MKFGITAVAKSTFNLFHDNHFSIRLLLMYQIPSLANESALIVNDISFEETESKSVPAYAFFVSDANSNAQVKLFGTVHQVYMRTLSSVKSLNMKDQLRDPSETDSLYVSGRFHSHLYTKESFQASSSLRDVGSSDKRSEGVATI